MRNHRTMTEYPKKLIKSLFKEVATTEFSSHFGSVNTPPSLTQVLSFHSYLFPSFTLPKWLSPSHTRPLSLIHLWKLYISHSVHVSLFLVHMLVLVWLYSTNSSLFTSTVLIIHQKYEIHKKITGCTIFYSLLKDFKFPECRMLLRSTSFLGGLYTLTNIEEYGMAKY